MKITRIGPSFPLLTASTLGGGGGSVTPSVGSGLVPVSTGSNSWAWGSNVQWITANGSNVIPGPFVNFAAGSNIILAVSSNTINIASTGGGSVSYGSNSNQVSLANAPGAATEVSRADHVHLGVTSLAHSSNTFSGPVVLAPGTNMAITSPVAGTFTLHSAGVGGGGGGTPLTVKDEGTPLTTDATSLDFVGAGVVASGAGAAKTITIAGGGLVLITSQTASASATLDFTTAISSTYDEYVIEAVDIIAATNATTMLLRVGTGGGPTYDSGANYNWTRNYFQVGTAFAGGSAGSTAQTGIACMILVSSTAPTAFTVRVKSPQNASYSKLFEIEGVQTASDGLRYKNYGGAGEYVPTTALTALRFLMSAGNITSGVIRAYGVAK